MQQPLLSQTYMAFAIHSDTLTCAGSLLLDSMLSGGPCEPKEFPSFHGGVRKNESDPHESSFEFVRRVQIYLNPEDSSPRQLHSPPMMRDESSVELVLYAGSSMPSPLRRIPIRNDRNHSLRSPAKSPDPQAPASTTTRLVFLLLLTPQAASSILARAHLPPRPSDTPQCPPQPLTDPAFVRPPQSTPPTWLPSPDPARRPTSRHVSPWA